MNRVRTHKTRTNQTAPHLETRGGQPLSTGVPADAKQAGMALPNVENGAVTARSCTMASAATRTILTVRRFTDLSGAFSTSFLKYTRKLTALLTSNPSAALPRATSKATGSFPVKRAEAPMPLKPTPAGSTPPLPQARKHCSIRHCIHGSSKCTHTRAVVDGCCPQDALRPFSSVQSNPATTCGYCRFRLTY